MINTQHKKIKPDETKNLSQYTYIGIDLSKKYLDIWIGGAYKKLANDSKGFKTLCSWVRNQPGEVLIAYESTGSLSLYLSEELDREGIKRRIIVPSRIRNYARSRGNIAKTDKIDCRIIAEYAQERQITPDKPMKPEMLRMRQLQRARAMHSKIAAQLKAALQNYHDETALASLKQAIAEQETHCLHLRKQIEQIIAADAQMSSLYNLLLTFDGIGERVAKAILCDLPEIGTLSRREIASLVGVAPFNWDSGGHIGKRIPRFGRKEIRCHLYLSIIACLHCKDSDVRQRYADYKKRGKPSKIAIIACLRWYLGRINATVKAWRIATGYTSMPTIS